jgi:hypothetical protein
MRYRFRSIIYLHGYAVTKIKTTFAAQPPPLRIVSSEQVEHMGVQPTRVPLRSTRAADAERWAQSR